VGRNENLLVDILRPKRLVFFFTALKRGFIHELHAPRFFRRLRYSAVPLQNRQTIFPAFPREINNVSVLLSTPFVVLQ